MWRTDCWCRERLWRRFADDIIYELDNPAAATARREREERERAARAGGGAGGARGSRYRDSDDAGGVDKAYAREYLQPDQKRARKE